MIIEPVRNDTNNLEILESIYGKVDCKTFISVMNQLNHTNIFDSEAATLAAELREYANTNGVTASSIAQELGINRSSVTRWLNGASLPRREGTIKKVKAYLNKHWR